MSTHAKSGMTPGQTVWIIVLTVLYLIVELAFNARLLDVAGGSQTEAVHGLENFGRGLSGIAVALFVLQVMLARRAHSLTSSPRVLAIVFWCALSAALTFGTLKLLVDVLVDSSSGRFRKAAATLVVVRAELLKGQALLDGLAEDAGLFERSEGKAFAALFPVLGVQIWDRVDQGLAPMKPELMGRAIDSRLGGSQGYYRGPFSAALAQLRKAFLGELPREQLQSLFEQEFEKAWADYTQQMRQRRWTPDTVPYQYRQRVIAEMNRKLGVPRNWDPSDRATFRAAVERQVLQRLRSQPGTVYDKGRAVAGGLNWPAYVAHPVNQQRLQQALQLPAHIAVRHEYSTGQEFEERLYRPMLKASTASEIFCLDLPEASFLSGGENEARGREAAQTVLVAPIALLSSLLGAIAHLAKLLYQSARLAVVWLPSLAALQSRLIVLPLAVVVGAGVLIGLTDNAVTTSRVHRFIREQALAADEGLGQALWTRTVLGAMHTIEIGQGYGYSVNHWMRMNVLQGFEFGTVGKKSTHQQAPAPKASGCEMTKAT